MVFYPTMTLIDDWFVRRRGMALGVMYVSSSLHSLVRALLRMIGRYGRCRYCRPLRPQLPPLQIWFTNDPSDLGCRPDNHHALRLLGTTKNPSLSSIHPATSRLEFHADATFLVTTPRINDRKPRFPMSLRLPTNLHRRPGPQSQRRNSTHHPLQRHHHHQHHPHRHTS